MNYIGKWKIQKRHNGGVEFGKVGRMIVSHEKDDYEYITKESSDIQMLERIATRLNTNMITDFNLAKEEALFWVNAFEKCSGLAAISKSQKIEKEVDKMLIEKEVSISDIEAGQICKKHSNGYSTYNDISIRYYKVRHSNIIRMCLAHSIFKKFKYIKLSVVGNKLFFILSNENCDNTAYTISVKKGSYSTVIQGENTTNLKEFVGDHFIKQYDYRINDNPIFYVEVNKK